MVQACGSGDVAAVASLLTHGASTDTAGRDKTGVRLYVNATIMSNRAAQVFACKQFMHE